jgi:rhamnulokinase
MESKNFLAVDLGASNGRVLLGTWDGAAFQLQELHRFPNGPVNVHGHLYWDALRLWTEIKQGLCEYSNRFTAPLTSIGIDTWGVDFALLDAQGRLLGNPRHYRDSRNDGILEWSFDRTPSSEIFSETGIQFMQINTLFQLLSMVRDPDPQLQSAQTLLMMPDLFNYWLTGRKVAEYTIASTSQMINPWSRDWSTALLRRVGLPLHLLPEIVKPGTILAEVMPEVRSETGLSGPALVIAAAGHDTAAAVAAIPGLNPHSAYISSGTWSLVGVENDHPIVNQEALDLNFTNEGGVFGTVRLLKNVTGLWLLQESRSQWKREGRDYDWDQLLAEAADSRPFLCFVDPDADDFRAPGDMPTAIRRYCRQTGQLEPATVGAVVRCCLESLALKSRLVLEGLARLTGRRIEDIRVVGGGCQNRMLCQFTADACQRPVVTGPVEATALGNIMVQAIAAGCLPDLQAGRQAIADSVKQERLEPREQAEWEAAYQRFAVLQSKTGSAA